MLKQLKQHSGYITETKRLKNLIEKDDMRGAMKICSLLLNRMTSDLTHEVDQLVTMTIELEKRGES